MLARRCVLRSPDKLESCARRGEAANVSKLEGATVVVVGGSSGIGLATAMAALVEGATVVVTGRSKARLDDARKRLDEASTGSRVRAVELDSTDETGTQALFESLPSVDHIFVSAATVGTQGGLASESALARPALDTRFWGSLFAAKYGSRRMPPTGSITFCSGVSTHRPRPNASVGAASGGAVEAFARALAVDLAPIRVNTVVPGLIDTPLVAGLFGGNREALLAQAAKSMPVGRIGRPEDVADAVLFLMKNSFVTGISLVVDGGRLLV
jgi:NAD(P)-dependent dehydrogenase (short-subunit alcohol dehydrogenase family)